MYTGMVNSKLCRSYRQSKVLQYCFPIPIPIEIGRVWPQKEYEPQLMPVLRCILRDIAPAGVFPPGLLYWRCFVDGFFSPLFFP